MNKTIIDKIWDNHIVCSTKDNQDVIYIDHAYIHEVTSPQAFEGIEKRKINVFRPRQILATTDHNVPTKNQHLPIEDEDSRYQIETLLKNTEKHNIKCFGIGHKFNGIVHVIGPELGITLPGMTIVCGDSHTSTHGALGAIAFGVGTSELEMVLGTQCIIQKKPKIMRITINGNLKKGVTSKDVILYVINKLTTSGGTGYFTEFTGSAVKAMSIEARMTLCNMSIEMGSRGSIIAPDEVTFAYLKGRAFAPTEKDFSLAVEKWKKLYTDEDAVFDKEYEFKADDIQPMITYGTSPDMSIPLLNTIPETNNNTAADNALRYMDVRVGETLIGKKIDYVFLGSCTNGRIEDFRMFAEIVKGRRKAENVIAWLVPGSKLVEEQIQKEGIDEILKNAGFEIRQPGCSACLSMNEDKVPPGKYCIATTNRNFEGRQGPGARTFLSSPYIAAVAAITGQIENINDYLEEQSYAN